MCSPQIWAALMARVIMQSVSVNTTDGSQRHTHWHEYMEASRGAATADTHMLFIKAFRLNSNWFQNISHFQIGKQTSHFMTAGWSKQKYQSRLTSQAMTFNTFLTVFRLSLLFVELEPEELGPSEEFRYYQDVIISLNTPASLHLCQFALDFTSKTHRLGWLDPVEWPRWECGWLGSWKEVVC